MRRSGVAIALAVLIAGLLFAACGGSDPESGSNAASNGDDTRAGAEQPLNVALSAEPRSLDSLLDSESAADTINRNVYQPLTERDANGEIQPLLATSYEQDGKSWTFDLREGVTFHDGSAMTAEDVVASFDRILNPKLKSLFKDSYLPGVTGAEAVDDLTVKINTETPDPTLPSKVSLIIIASAEFAAPDDKRMTTAMMGTGPYRFVDWSKGNELNLARYDDYWGEPAVYPTVHIVFRPETSVRLDALKAGEVDIAQFIPPDLAGEAPKTASAPLSEVTTMRIASLPGDPLADERLREAVNLAVDREGIMQGLYAGQATSASGNVVIEPVLGFNPDLEDYPFDPERAKQLVQEAGAEGTKLTFTVPIGRFAKDREIGQAIVDQLNTVGFDVQGDFVEVTKWGEAAFYPESNPDATPDLTYFGLSNDLFDAYFTLSQYMCGTPISANCDKEIDAVLDKAKVAGTIEEREQALQEAMKLFHDGYYFLPVATPNQVHGIAADLEWTPRPQIFMYFNDIKRGG